jgi:hypothetical protein
MVSYSDMFWLRKRCAYHMYRVGMYSPAVPIRRYKRRMNFMNFLDGLLDWHNGGITDKIKRYKYVIVRRKRKKKHLTNGNMLNHYRENVR